MAEHFIYSLFTWLHRLINSMTAVADPEGPLTPGFGQGEIRPESGHVAYQILYHPYQLYHEISHDVQVLH